jgi:hypothetical protein
MCPNIGDSLAGEVVAGESVGLPDPQCVDRLDVDRFTEAYRRPSGRARLRWPAADGRASSLHALRGDSSSRGIERFVS